MSALYIAAAGAVTPLGLDVDRTVASLRSGLDRFQEIPFAGQTGEDIKASRIAGYLEGLGDIDRYEALALQAIEPCLAGLGAAHRAQIAIMIGLPRDTRPGVPAELPTRLTQRLAARLGIQARAVYALSLGRVSVHHLLAQADRMLRSESLIACIVGGVDTLINAECLAGLAEAGAIKEDWDGFIPGEAAAFVRVQREAPASGVWSLSAPTVMGIGLAQDPARGNADDPLVGVGMTAAYRSAMTDSGLDEKAVALLVNDVNGSRVAFEDAAMAGVRFFRSPRSYLETWHVASHLGETGAAVGALGLIWASAALELGWAPGATVMLGASDADLRSAVVLHARVAEPFGHRRQVSLGVPIEHRPQSGHAEPQPDLGMSLPFEDRPDVALAKVDFSELGWLLELRESHHRGADPWQHIADFERRLLAHLDALVWSNGTGRDLAQAALQSEEASEVSAATAVLLSQMPERDLIAWFERALRDPGPRRDGVLAVLPHLPHAASEPVLRAGRLSDDPSLRAATLRAATLAGCIDGSDIAEQFGATPEAVAPELIHAIASAGLHSWAEPACRLVGSRPGMTLLGVNRVALLCIAPAGAVPHLLDVRALARDMPLALALLCLRDDLSFARFAETLNSQHPAILEALGWSGELTAVPTLLDALRSGPPAAKRAAANALFRISGVACFEDVAAPADDTGDSAQSTRTVRQLSQDAQRWESELLGLGRWSKGSGRWRHGEPWSPSSALHHLRRPECAHAERLVAAWEHALVNRAALPCQPTWFVARQRHALASLLPPAMR